MRLLVRGLLLVGLVDASIACSFPRPADSEPDGPTSDGAPDASGLDSDQDGVDDAFDNCVAVANPKVETMGRGLVQRDHDGDGRGDACDPCPHLEAATDTDADGDGIGTACDPDDTVKNPPAEFNGFYDPPSASDWSAPSGVGSITDWEVVRTADNKLWWKQKVLDGTRHQLLRNRPEIKEVYVDTTFRIHEIQPAAGPDVLRSVGVTYGFFRQGGVDLYFSCGVRHDAQALVNMTASTAYSDNTLRTGENQEVSWTGNLVERSVHVIGRSTQVDRGGGDKDSSLSCTAYAPDPPLDRLVNSTSTLFPDGKVGLRTFGMAASFDYIFIVDRARVQ